MNLPLFLQGLGSVGVFASRAFLPAFVTALLLRFGPEIPWLARSGLIPSLRGVPTWFTSDASLIVLGLLSALELWAERSPEAKSVLHEVQGYLKAGMAALTFLGVLQASDRAAVGPMIRADLFDYLPVGVVGAATFAASRFRSALIRPLTEADEDDDLGLQGLIRWVEDLWAGLGPMALILFPILTLAAFVGALAVVVVVERKLESRRERAKVPCAHCGLLIHPSAPACPSCKTPAASPRAVGFLGEPRESPADPARLPYQLVAVKRCPACAGRLHKKSVKQACEACGHRLMDDPEFAARYVGSIDRRVPLTVGVVALLGLVPVLGIIPGVVYYRLAIVAPFRRYIPTGQGFLLRWGIRLAIVVLVALQWIPVAGGLALPSMALINYAAYRTAYRKAAPSP